MKLAMSNIAWSPSVDEDVGSILRAAGLSGVEIAPTRIWPLPLEAAPAEIADYRRDWEQRGLPIVALQALLFGQDSLRLFEDGAEGRARMLAYLEGIVELGARLGAAALVFGSPKARRRDGLSRGSAARIAADFFGAVGDAAVRHGICLCIEPNPPEYGADFVLNAEEAIDLVATVDHPGFALHLDTACMHLADDDASASIRTGAPLLRHFHVSEPNLGAVGTGSQVSDHDSASAALREVGYDRYVSVEMRAMEPERQLEAVGTAAAFLGETYG